MSDNVTRYEAVRALPPFALFPWLFVVPGLLMIVAAGLAGTRRRPLRPEPAETAPAPEVTPTPEALPVPAREHEPAVA